MPLYYYKAAIQGKGEVVEGQMNAASEKAVSSKLQQIGYLPITITSSEKSISKKTSLFSSDINNEEVLFLTGKLALTLKAGLALDACLRLLKRSTNSKSLQSLLNKVSIAVEDGKALSDALEQHSAAFDRFYVNTLRAGEISGSLQHVLRDLEVYLEHKLQLRKKLISALIYPVVLMAVTVATLIILLLFVVPQFQDIFEQMGQTLPLSTQIVIAVSDFIAHKGWIVALVAIIGFFLFYTAMKDENKRRPFDLLTLKLPLISEAIKKLETTRFSRTMATLLSNGVPMLAALDVVKESLNHTVMRQAIFSVREQVQSGQTLSKAITQQNVFPDMAIQLIHVGEETGELANMLREVSEIYDAELGETIDRILVILEPAIIISLGITIAAIIISVLLAILSLNDFVV